MNFNYTQGIPASANNPSDDQPDMKENNDSNFGIWNVDHYGFVNALGGWHKNIRLPQISGNADPAPVTIPANAGQIYTKTVNGDLELFYQSSSGIVNQLTNDSSILTRAAVNFSVAATVVTVNNSFNVTSVIRSGPGTYVITFTNALSSTFYYVSVSSNIFGRLSGNLTTTCTLTFVNNSGVATDPTLATVTISL